MKARMGVRAERFFNRRVLARIGSVAARFGVGFVLAQGRVFGETTPFGVSLAASTGADGVEGVFGALGAAVGALTAWRLGDGMKYIAACMLALVTAKAFCGTKIGGTRAFGAATAALSIAVVGFVFVAAEGFPLRATIVFVCEVALAGLGGLVFPLALHRAEGDSGSRADSLLAASRLLFCALLLLGLSGVPFFAGMTVGRTAATVLVLSAAAGGGMGAGAAAGVALGIVFDIGGGGGFYSMCYGAAGLVAGVAGSGSRMYGAMAYVLVSAAAALLDGAHFSALYETFVASVLFMLIPAGKIGLVDFLAPPETGSTLAAERRALAAQHRAIGELLSETAREISPDGVPTSSPDRAVVRTAARVCRGCALRAVCWERERDDTMDQLRGSYERFAARGGVEQGDLPPSFRTRCLRTDEFVDGLGEEYRVYQLERRRAAEDSRRKSAAAVRLYDAALLMADVADDITAGMSFDAAAQSKARRALLAENCAADVTAYRLPNGRLCLELSTLRVSGSVRAALERAVGCRLCEPRPTDDGSVLLYERGEFSVSAAAMTRRRKGSPKNGDCGSCFHAPRGRHACVLADGMGSGAEAAAESARAMGAVERLVSAGVPTCRAVEAYCDLAYERGGGVFSTLDLLVIDDYDAKGELVKLGAAATYFRVDGVAVKAEGSASPVLPGARPKAVTVDLSRCDRLLMLTDGVCDADDDWLRELVENFDGSAEQLARAAMAKALHRTGGSDDMTVLAVSLER